jgi:hypothetical protein
MKGGAARAALAESKSPRHSSMGSLSGSERRRAVFTTAMLCVMRKEGTFSEEEVAERLEFGSAEAMYAQLTNWGLPEWLAYPSGSPKQEHREYREPPSGKRRRRARRGEAEAIALPPARYAAPLFKEALEELSAAIELLGARQEHLKDERFVATYTDTEVPTQPPSKGTFFYGAEQHPPEPLTTLIAMYALVEEGNPDDPLKPLLAALHPKDWEPDQERLEQALNDLKHKAGQLATLVRGGRLRRGPSTEEISSQQHLVAWYIHHRREAGLLDEEILEGLSQLGINVTPEEMKRLGNFRLP